MRTTEDLIESLVSSCKPMVNDAQSVTGVRINRQTLTPPAKTVRMLDIKALRLRSLGHQNTNIYESWYTLSNPCKNQGFAISYWRSNRQNTNLWMAFCCPHPTIGIWPQLQESSRYSTHTVDGRNPAPVSRSFVPLFTKFYTSQVVQDFFHQHVFPMSSISDLLIPPNGGNVFSPEEWSLVGPNKVTTWRPEEPKNRPGFLLHIF